MWHIWERREMYTMVWWGNLMAKTPLGRPRHRLEDNVKEKSG